MKLKRTPHLKISHFRRYLVELRRAPHLKICHLDSLVFRDEQILGQDSGKPGQNLGQKLGKRRPKFGQHFGHRQFYNNETRFADIMSEMLFKILLNFAQIMSQIMSEILHKFAQIFIIRAAAAAANVFGDKIWDNSSDDIWDKFRM